MNRLKSILAACLSLVLLITCANERAISGGPEDLEAPEIIFSKPGMGSTQVDPGTGIELRFSEQMLRESVENAVEFWPYPPGGYELEATWRSLKVQFNKALPAGETFLLTLDKSAQDLRRNGLAETYILAFSTGDSLNKGLLTGFVEGGQDLRKQGQLLLYRDYQENVDSLRSRRADYAFQPDDSGRFRMPYLAEQSYLLVYHWDRNRNNQVDDGDYFGRPSSPTVYPTLAAEMSGFGIWPQLVPSTQTSLLRAELHKPDLILLRFKVPVDVDMLPMLEVNTPLGKHPLKGATTVEEDEYGALLHLAIPIQDSTEVWVSQFQDTSGTFLRTDTLLALQSTRDDTTNIALIEVEFAQDKDGYPEPEEGIVFSLNHPVTPVADSLIILRQIQPDTALIGGQARSLSSTQIIWEPDSALAGGASFRWQMDTRLLNPIYAEPAVDSVRASILVTEHPDSLGALILTQDLADLVIGEIRKRDYHREFMARRGEEISLTELPSGYYQLRAFADLNGNRQYDAGGREMGHAAEPFWIYPEPVRVRARWDLDIGTWRLGIED